MRLPNGSGMNREVHGEVSWVYSPLSMLKGEKTAKIGLNIKRNKAEWRNRYLMKTLEACNFYF